jgi:hypothetical protein
MECGTKDLYLSGEVDLRHNFGCAFYFWKRFCNGELRAGGGVRDFRHFPQLFAVSHSFFTKSICRSIALWMGLRQSAAMQT